MKTSNSPEYTSASKPSEPGHLDSTYFRSALGQFATGITIITAQCSSGKPVGVTANSFNAVSLSPPLVLWSVSKQSSSHAAFAQACHYGVSILSGEQEALSNHFASFKGDRFADLEVLEGKSGVRFIPGALVHLECRVRSRYEEGDHVIMVGEVEHCAYRDGQALVYRSRQYFSV